MTNDEYYQKISDKNTFNMVLGFCIFLTTVFLSMVVYGSVDNAYNAQTAENVSVVIFALGLSISMFTALYFNGPWVRCDDCGMYIDITKEFYVISHREKHINKNRQYHQLCFKEMQSLK